MMKINRRLILLVTVPLAVALTFSALALAPAASQALQAHRLTVMVEAASAASDLSHQLRRERAAATALVADKGRTADFKKAMTATDKSIDRFTEQRGRLSALPANADAALRRVDGALNGLPSLRAQVRSGGSTFSTLAFGYRILIADLIDYRDGIAQADGVDSDIADRIRAAAAMSTALEHMGQQQVIVLRALDAGEFTEASKRSFEATRLGYTDATESLFALGQPEWRSSLERTVSGAKAASVQRLEDGIGRAVPGQALKESPGEWYEATSEGADLLRSVEREIDQSIQRTVGDERRTLIWWAVAEAVLVLSALVGTVLFAHRVGRVMIRRLRELRNAANDVAHTHLPRMMRELSRPGASARETPEEIAQKSSSLVGAAAKDEIGEVGEAFNAVHYEAVRLAAEQAHSRAEFAETLVGAARRGSRLTSVMVSELDTVQRDESDPERMKVLFALDHLAIRMERNTNNLLVMGGSGQGRVRTEDVALATVLVAAAQQVENFERVKPGSVDATIVVASRVVHDLAHILAELLDNALKFSPPDSTVGVAAWRLADRVVVQVVDDGVGLTAERRAELNETLAEPRGDVGAIRFMGLHVVARLAARYGIDIELRESAGPGTIAEVTLPASVLAEDAELPEGTALDGAGVGTWAETPRRRQPVEARPAARPEPEHVRAQEPARAQEPESGDGRPRTDGPVRGDRPVRGDEPGRPSVRPEPVRAERERDERGASGRPAPSWASGEASGGATEPAESATSTTASGLPVRRRGATTGQTQGPAGARAPGRREDGGARAAAPAAAKAPKKRDSRQVSDVFAAYTKGISRSTSRRPGGAVGDSDQPAHEDHTQRSSP